MSLMKNIIYFIFIVYCSYPSLAREEWIDPHDMGINDGERRYMQTNNNEKNCETYNSQDGLHLRNILNLILDTVYFKRNTNKYEGRLNVELNKDDYNFLVRIQSGHKSYSRRQFEQVLRNSLHMDNNPILSIWERFEELFSLHTEKILMTIGLISLSIFLWKVKPYNYSFSMLFKLFLPLAYMADFGLRYLALLEEVEVDHFIKIANYEKCDPEKMGWIAWMWDKFTHDCVKNDREMLLAKRPAFHIITPLKVIGQQFDVTAVILTHIGTGFGQFAYALIGNVPWYLTPFMAVLTLILTFILLLMFGTQIMGVSTKLCITPFYKIEFLQKGENGEDRREKGDSLSGENLKLLLESKTQNTFNFVPEANTQSNNTHHVSTPGFRVKNSKGLKKKCGQTWRKALTNRACKENEEKTIEDSNSWPNWGGGDQNQGCKRRVRFSGID